MLAELRAELGELLEALINGYSAVYFSDKKVVGLLFMAATFAWPLEALEAIFCALVAIVFARALGFDRAKIRAGGFTFNPLLVGLAVAHYFSPSWSLTLTLALAGVMTTLIGACLQSVLEATFHLPQLSLAFVIVTVSVFNAARDPGALVHAAPIWGHPISLPGPVERFLLSVVAVFSRNDVVSGALAFLGLLIASRISAALAVVGYACGAYFYHAIPDASTVNFAGFNFVVSAIAIGGIYTVPSYRSYGLAAVAAALCASAAAWTAVWFKPFGTDVLSLPCLLTIYAFIGGLRMRAANGNPELVFVPAASPEDNLAIAQSRRLRQKDLARAWLRLPFIGSWHVSQGVNGAFTHQQKWRFALDFSVPGGDAASIGPAELPNFSAFGLPVISPQAGVVAKVVDGIADNDPGHMNAVQNWGNYVLLQHVDGTHSLLAHLRKGSVRFRPGDRVGVGEVIGSCGNSGRSPAPHIHYHVQRAPEPGGETLPFYFASYIRLNGVPALVERSLPREGEVIENLVISPSLRAAFDFLAGQRYGFDVASSKGRRVEYVTAGMDLGGWRYLESESDHARAYFHLTEDMFYMDYCSARPGTLLYALLLAMSKVPFVDTAGLCWRDSLPLNLFLKGLPRWGAEFILPFLPHYGVEAQRQFYEPADQAKGVGIRTRIEGFPFSFGDMEANVHFRPGEGPVMVSLQCGSAPLGLTARRIDAC